MTARATTPGTISWTDLATTDQDAAKEFYGGLFGWEYDEQPIDEDTTYSMAKLGGRTAAAISPQQPDETAAGIPPHWNVYVTVDDVDAASGKAGEAGGNVLAGPFDVMDVGRMSVVADPTGAVLCLWQAGDEHRRRGRQRAGRAGLGGHRDDRRRRRRRRSTPRCSAGDFEQMSEEPPYWVIFNGERSQRRHDGAARRASRPTGSPTSRSRTSTRRSRQARRPAATPFMGPIDVPNGRFALIQDPQGAAFAVLSSGDFDD